MKKWTTYKASIEEDAECYDILEQNEELKKENKRLKRKIRQLEFSKLPEDEQRWAENAYLLFGGKLFWSDILDFYWKYLDFTKDNPTDIELPF